MPPAGRKLAGSRAGGGVRRSSSAGLPAIVPRRPCTPESIGPERRRDAATPARPLGGRHLHHLLAGLSARGFVIDVLLVVPILAASAAAGLLLLRLLGALPRASHEHLLVGLATGLGLASMLGLALAAAGTLRPAPIAAAGLAALVAGAPGLLRALRAVRAP